MNKPLLTILLALVFVFSGAVNASPHHDRHKDHDRHQGHHGKHYKYKSHHKHKHHHKQRHHYEHRHHRDYGHHYREHGHHHRYEAGYFLGGLFIGSLLADHHDSYRIRREHHYSGPVYYRDGYGSCFRVEQRPFGENLIEVPRDKCMVRYYR